LSGSTLPYAQEIAAGFEVVVSKKPFDMVSLLFSLLFSLHVSLLLRLLFTDQLFIGKHSLCQKNPFVEKA
jgi:hypothetical protein